MKDNTWENSCINSAFNFERSYFLKIIVISPNSETFLWRGLRSPSHEEPPCSWIVIQGETPFSPCRDESPRSPTRPRLLQEPQQEPPCSETFLWRRRWDSVHPFSGTSKSFYEELGLCSSLSGTPKTIAGHYNYSGSIPGESFLWNSALKAFRKEAELKFAIANQHHVRLRGKKVEIWWKPKRGVKTQKVWSKTPPKRG